VVHNITETPGVSFLDRSLFDTLLKQKDEQQRQIQEHGMQTRSIDKNSVCPSVCLSNACIVTKRKKDLSRFLYHTKDHLA